MSRLTLSLWLYFLIDWKVMKIVVIASTNPVKIEVAKCAFVAVFPDETFDFVSVQSESGVPDQPMGEETRKGAKNRVAYVREKYPNGDFFVGQEGGLHTEGSRLYSRAWIAIMNKEGFLAESSTASFYLPIAIAQYVEEGMELGDACDKFFQSVNSKQGIGAIGHLTNGIINRAEYYLQTAIVALSELKHNNWYR